LAHRQVLLHGVTENLRYIVPRPYPSHTCD